MYIDANSVWQKAQSVSDGTATKKDATHILCEDGSAGEVHEGVTMLNVSGYSGLTISGLVYLSTTAGQITQTEPALGYSQQILGKAVSATEIAFFVDPIQAEGRTDISIGINASTAGSGIALTRASKTAIVRAYGDDGGAVLYGAGSVPDIRTTISRQLVTIDQTGGKVRLFGLQGLLASADGFWNEEHVAGVQGDLQIVRTSATLALGGYGKSAGLSGQVSTQGTASVAANHVVAGVMAISNIRTAFTITGAVAAFAADIYDSTNWSDSTARVKWPIGLYIPARAADCAIKIGDSASTAGSGLPIGTAITAAVRFHFDDGGVAITAADIRGMLVRTIITADHSAATGTITGFRSQLQIEGDSKLPAAVGAGITAALQGFLEGNGTNGHAATLGTYTTAVLGWMSMPAYIDGASNSVASAFCAYCHSQAGLSNTRAAVLAVPTGNGLWDTFLDLSGSSGVTQDAAAGADVHKYLKVYIANKLYTIDCASAT
jgi:hypothetical protein